MQWAKNKQGFTIVELLIVVVVIAILAAITIVAYNGVQNRTYDTSVQNDLAQIAKKLEEKRVLSADNTYPGDQANAGFTINVNKNAYITAPTLQFNIVICMPASGIYDGFLVYATSKSGNRYLIRNGGGVTAYTGSVNWNGSNSSAYCNLLISGYTARYGGYNSIDTSAGPWRAWAGGN